MRTLEFEVSPGVGPGTFKRSGSLRDLVLSIPYLRMCGLTPPLNVLNEVFRSGLVDSGMSGGCQWRPFEIAQNEYEELLESLADPGSTVKTVDVPNWVQTRSDWSIWVMEHVRGVPAAEHRRLTQEYEDLERQRKAAMDSGDSELAEALFVEVVRAGAKLGDFVKSHIDKREDRGRDTD
jgi:hypothetical protein